MAAAQPASANSAAADYFMSRVARSSVPKLLTEDERAWYKDIFGAIKHQEWAASNPCLPQSPMGRCMVRPARNIIWPPVRRVSIWPR
jgi:hypothetical protein